MFKNHKGFTLIELLVVIAIIGILATVVIGAVNSARVKGADAAIKSNLQALRIESELWYDNANTYGGTVGPGVCPISIAPTTFFTGSVPAQNALKAAGNNYAKLDANAPNIPNTVCWTNGVNWVAAAVLKSSPNATGKSFCVDSTGNSKEITALANATPITVTGNTTTGGCGV